MSAILEALRSPQQTTSRTKAGTRANARPHDANAGFASEGRLALDALSLSVQGQGALQQPIPPAQAQALHTVAVPSRYGLREATLRDPRVRDSGEIAGDALTLTWREGALEVLQVQVAEALGLARLEARVHSLLAYGPGQFFKPHQDTEKHPGMVATLVLVWPSAHIGGELCVRHGEREARFASQHLQATGLRWFAFYADCRHEVLPIAEGWRIVLTFDLVLPAEPLPVPADADPRLLAALKAQFFPAEGPRARPWMLLLEHEYSERGLRWPLLKGEDRERAAALRAAAQALGLVVHLALAEIHQQWSAVETYNRGRHGPGTPIPEDLLDEDMVLDFWVDADDRAAKGSPLRVSSADAQAFSDTDESFLVNQEYEGYMGNYGQTLDYWYRRAALVVRAPLAIEADRFDTDFDGALADALLLARGGQGELLAQRLRAASRTLASQRQGRGRSLLAAYAELAAALPEADEARSLCAGFKWSELKRSDARALARLAGRWGTPWMLTLMQDWIQPKQLGQVALWRTDGGPAAGMWPQDLAAFVQSCRRYGLEPAVIDAMLDLTRTTWIEFDRALAKREPRARAASLQQRLAAVPQLVEALELTSDPVASMDAFVQHLQQHPGLYPLLEIGPLLLGLPAAARAVGAASALRLAVIGALQQALDQPERADADRSLERIEWTCRCADCRPVIAWAESPAADALVLPMAEPRRQHVQTQLQSAAAPLSTEVLRQGSPHKLVIRKPAELPAERKALRQAWERNLAALQSTSR